MFQYLDASLDAFLRAELTVSKLTISFEPPKLGFDPSRPALSLFLYDIRENAELAVADRWEPDPKPDRTSTDPPAQRVRRRAPARIDCSYMITAWAGGDAVAEEHRLLGSTLQVLLRHRTFPTRHLAAELAEQSPPIPIRVSPGSQMQNIGDFWRAMDGPPKAALYVRLTVGVDTNTEIREETVGGADLDLRAGVERLPPRPREGDPIPRKESRR